MQPAMLDAGSKMRALPLLFSIVGLWWINCLYLIVAITALTLATSSAIYAQDAPPTQPWTASDGRVIQAKFIKLEGLSVIIEKDGKQFPVPFANLNEDSIRLAKKLSLQVAITLRDQELKQIDKNLKYQRDHHKALEKKISDDVAKKQISDADYRRKIVAINVLSKQLLNNISKP